MTDPRAAIDALTTAAAADPDAFWDREAQSLPWFRRWDSVLDRQPPTFRWFSGGQTNLCHDALDYQVGIGRADKTALICLDERGTKRTLTYASMRWAAGCSGWTRTTSGGPRPTSAGWWATATSCTRR